MFSTLALLQELPCLLLGLEACGQRGFHLRSRPIGILQGKHALHAVVRLALESLQFALALNQKAHGHTLHAACREGGLYLAPQYGRQLEAHQAVQHAAGLLCIYQIHVQMAWCLDGLQNGRFRNLMEHNAVGSLFVKSQHLAQMPGDGLSLAVFIACQPYLLGLLGLRLQFAHQLLLLFGNLIFGFQCLVVDAQFLLLQVTNVAVARHHLVVFAKKLLDSFRLGRRLHDYQILLHTFFC